MGISTWARHVDSAPNVLQQCRSIGQQGACGTAQHHICLARGFTRDSSNLLPPHTVSLLPATSVRGRLISPFTPSLPIGPHNPTTIIFTMSCCKR